MDVFTLKEHIDQNYESQKDFAAAQGVKPPQVTQWINAEFVVVGNILYSPRRKLERKYK